MSKHYQIRSDQIWFTGSIDFNSASLENCTIESASYSLTSSYVNGLAEMLAATGSTEPVQWLDSVLGLYNNANPLPDTGSLTTGSRYIALVTSRSWTADYIYTFDGTIWKEYVTEHGDAVINASNSKVYTYSGSSPSGIWIQETTLPVYYLTPYLYPIQGGQLITYNVPSTSSLATTVNNELIVRVNTTGSIKWKLPIAYTGARIGREYHITNLTSSIGNLNVHTLDDALKVSILPGESYRVIAISQTANYSGSGWKTEYIINSSANFKFKEEAATLVVGLSNSNYSSGSIIAGSNNSNNGLNSFIIGNNNINSGSSSTLSGYRNTNSGNNSSISGYRNTNSGNNSSLSGYYNTNSGLYSIIYGINNINLGHQSILMGSINQNSGDNSFVVGTMNTNSGSGGDVIIAGASNVNNNPREIIAGCGNIDYYSGKGESSGNNILSGLNNIIKTSNSIISGEANHVTGSHSAIFGGLNENSGSYSIIGGFSNINNGAYSFIDGYNNNNSGSHSILSGLKNINYSSYSSLSGYYNTNSGVNCSVAGARNTTSGVACQIMVGVQNSVSGNYASIISGHKINGTLNDTAYGNNIYVTGSDDRTGSLWIDDTVTQQRYKIYVANGILTCSIW